MEENKNTEESKKKIVVEKHRWPDEIAKEKTKRRNRMLIILACILCFGGGFVLSNIGGNSNYANTASTKQDTTDSEKFNRIYDVLSEEWYFGKDVEDLSTYIMDNAIRGMANDNEMDTHTQYLDADDASVLMNSLSGSLTGIGIQYYEVGNDLMVEKVYVGAPAEKGGMKEGDIIKKVDGVDISGKKIEEIKSMIVGEAGTSVSIDVLRGSENKKLKMVREELSLTVYGYIEGNTGILEISSFSEKTAEEVESNLKMFKEKDVKNIVIDVRNNGGGYVNTAIDIASLLIEPEEVVLYQEDKNGTLTEYVTTKQDEVFKFDSYVVLVNENTASASELLSAALEQHLDAKLVGTKTYGKGTVQKTITFNDGSIFKYTIAQWLTPNKEKINKVGIEPSEEVKLDEAITYVPNGEDKNEYKVDSVGDNVRSAQTFLKFLGYNVDRNDGYYSNATLEAIKKYQIDNGYEANEIINGELVNSLLSSASRKWHDEKATLDVQKIRALEVANGK